MKAHITAGALASAIRRLSPPEDERTLPWSMRLAAEGGRLMLSRHNRRFAPRVFVATWRPAEVEADGEVCLDPRPLLPLLDSVPHGTTVALEPGTLGGYGHGLTLAAATWRYTVRLPADDPPGRYVPAEQAETVTLDGEACDALARALAFVAPAMSRDEGRENLYGVHVFRVRDGLCLVATDGHQLSTTTLPDGFPWPAALPLIVHRDGVREVLETLQGEPAEARLSLTGTTLVVETDDDLVLAPLVDMPFPTWTEVVPRSFARTVRLPRAPFTEALRRLAPHARRHGEGVELHLGPERATVRIVEPEGVDGEETLLDVAGPHPSAGRRARLPRPDAGAAMTGRHDCPGCGGTARAEAAALRERLDNAERDRVDADE